ncbi:MAG: DUF421 domain-containing protein [Oscillospiraceae bacterium]
MGVSFVRTIIIFVLLIVSLRIMGKRQLGELEPIELVVAVLISNLAAQPLQDVGIPLVYGIIPVLTLLACQLIMSGLSVKYTRVRRLICGKPSILIDNGKIVQSEMRKNRISLDELYVELRSMQVTDIESVKHAILETDGTLSVLLYQDQSPVTPAQIGIKVEECGSPVSIISDGRTMKENLTLVGKNEKWLSSELRKRGVKSPSSVYLMTIDGAGNIYFVKKDASN